MTPRRELLTFAVALGTIVAGFLGASLFGDKVLSPADVLYASASFPGKGGLAYEPANRLLMDPVLQFQPWLEHNRAMLRRGRLPLWNRLAGCGAPHLANGQSAVFDPFHAIAYLGSLPEAHAPMAAARLGTAGLGMFLLARAWGFGPWGRWFAGLAFPFSGFPIAWLLYPVTSVAVWMPWLFLTTDRVLRRPGSGSIARLAMVVGLTLLAGHVQTAAHVLLAVGLYVVWRLLRDRREADDRPGGVRPRSALPAWAGGVLLGIALGAVAIVPLGFYLSRSPVWADRVAERPPAWTLARPRLLEAVCTALPYAFGSQRRGHPNLARGLGVNNLNESVGGFAGLATLIWLAPLAWSARREQPRVRFLAALVGFGAAGAFRLPPVDNLLRAIPVLDVTDNRRLTLWVAFGLVALGGIGLDHLDATRRGRTWGRWPAAWIVGALGLIAASGLIVGTQSRIEAKARDHYARAAADDPAADPAVFADRAARQAKAAVEVLPRTYAMAAGQLLGLAGLAAAIRRGRAGPGKARAVLLGVTMLDLFGFGLGLNPAIDPADDRPPSPAIAAVQAAVGGEGRALGIGAELPPNTLMRYGLADVRNYDSVEARRSLDWLEPLFEPEPGRPSRTSRREVTWEGVLRARDRLRDAGVRAIVAASEPPAGAFARVERIGPAWIARLDGRPIARLGSGGGVVALKSYDHGLIRIQVSTGKDEDLIVAETFDPGWRAEVDGRPASVVPHRGAFLSVEVGAGAREVVLTYDPPEVRAALGLSLAALAAIVAACLTPLTRARGPRKNRAIALAGPVGSGYNRSRDLRRPQRPIIH